MKIKSFLYMVLFLTVVMGMTMGASGCIPGEAPTTTDGGISQASADIATGIDGLTAEQRNVKKRLEADNEIGSIKHLYVMSAYSGQVLIYSTVDTKVSSSGKRLSPTSVASIDGQYIGSEHYGIPVNIGGYQRRTAEVLQDDGTYGSSSPYLYWFDTMGNYHQHYVSGGQIVHVSDEPLAVTDVVIRIGTVEE